MAEADSMSAILCLGSDLILAAVILAAAAVILASLTIPALLAHPLLAMVIVVILAGALAK